jgi:hypothetical protein
MSEATPLAGSQLVGAIAGTIDIGSTIAKVVEYTLEEQRTQEQLDWIKWWLDAYGSNWVNAWETRAKADPSSVVSQMGYELAAHLQEMAVYSRSQLLMSAGGFPATANMIGLRAKILANYYGIGTVTDLALGIPQSICLNKARYYWNSQAPWRLPDPTLAFKMLMEGDINYSEFSQLCLYNGWDSQWHQRIYNVLDTDPDIYMAFSMFVRGYITWEEMVRCFKIAGYDEKWHQKLYQYLQRIPSFYDLTRLADYTPLDPVYIAEVLRGNGFRESDIPRLTTYLMLRPLREEIRSVVGRLIFEYENGRISRDTLESELKNLQLQPKEIELNLLWADKRYYDKLLDWQIDIIEQRVKKGNITDKDQIVTELTNIGIRLEIANLMAEKWYWQYLAP